MAVIRETIRQTHQTLEDAAIPDARWRPRSCHDGHANDPSEHIRRAGNGGAYQCRRGPGRLVAQRLERVPLAYILGVPRVLCINVVVTPDRP